jgi:hypothetical protein
MAVLFSESNYRSPPLPTSRVAEFAGIFAFERSGGTGIAPAMDQRAEPAIPQAAAPVCRLSAR